MTLCSIRFQDVPPTIESRHRFPFRHNLHPMNPGSFTLKLVFWGHFTLRKHLFQTLRLDWTVSLDGLLAELWQRGIYKIRTSLHFKNGPWDLSSARNRLISLTSHFQVVGTMRTWLSRSKLIIGFPLLCYLCTCCELFDKTYIRHII